MNTNKGQSYNAKEVQISQFLHSSVKKLHKFLKKISKTYHDVEHNKRICGAIFDRVSALEVTIRSLNFQWDEHKESYTHKKHIVLQKILCNIRKLEKFVDDVTKSKGIRNIQVESIEAIFYYLTKEFDRYIDKLDLAILVDVERRKQEEQILRNDIEDLNKCLENMLISEISKQNVDKFCQ
ncbi:44690_t:CDS:2 [Gigaspora margarita]|uniref:44690_t:CDS:1 n=1 Tax=Gigaspora margarita TaxID=4874 RepID=A0ABN7UXP1_GIGMA|nr:44690_t:CDS:2 [Gigaspora margarita]